MKKNISYLLFFICLSIETFAQSFTINKNAVLEGTLREASAYDLDGKDPSKSAIKIQYFDGMGRALQTIGLQTSPLKRDIVEISTYYDYMGRKTRNNLPVPSRDFSGFYQNGYSLGLSNFYNQVYAYNWDVSFDSDPSQRPLLSTRPGDNYRTTGRTITNKFETNDGTIRSYYVANDGSVSSSYYPANTLTKRTVINEQYNDVIEYVDKKGHMLQREVNAGSGTYLKTAYIYDIMGRLRYVVQPKAFNQAAAFSQASAVFSEGVFAYQYDERGRVVRKHVPGAGWSNLVYDQMDRLVMSQNSRQTVDSKWSFFRYDKLGRNILKGETITASSQVTLQAGFNIITNPYEVYNGSGTFGYSNQSFPITINESDVNEAGYYDNYSWLGGLYGFQANSNYPISPYSNATGLVTGHRKRNLQNTGQILIDVNYYDDNNRVIQMQNTHILGGTNLVFNKYNFPGELISTTTTYRQSGKADVNTLTEYEMDHVGRKVKMTHKIDNNTVKTVKYYYDEIGRMSSKVIPTAAATSPVYSQLSLKVFLQGAYDANSGIMTGALKAVNMLPKNEPYSLYNKYSFIDPAENKPLANTVLNVLGSNEIVDWIVVELRDLPDRVVANKAFVLKRDGNVVNPEDGTYALKMKAPPGNYYVSVRHRNHLPVMTKYQTALSSGSATMVDLINSPTLYTSTGINTPAKIVNGKTMLWAGDANSDGQVIFQGTGADSSPVISEVYNDPDNSAGVSSFVVNKIYKAEDINMDSKVVYTGPGSDTDLILYNVVNHPENPQQSSSYTIKNPVVTNSFAANQVSGILQKIDYGYHIRGGVNCINCDASAGTSLNANENDLFSMKLTYEESNEYYDDNIAKQSWLSKVDNIGRNYSYAYDAASRLTAAGYTPNSGTEQYSVNNMTYDLNGNILSMNRYGSLNSGTGLIDQLSYNYSGNRLSYVNDGVTGNNDVGDFRNNNTGTDDYDYWADGSLKLDKNKGITNITYNYLNLPQEITFGSGQKIVYAYDGGGNKLEKQVLLNGVLQRSTAYIQAMVYEKTGAAGTYNFYQLATDEGRAVYESNAWVYEWNYTDHLGNNRLSFREVGGVAVISQSQNYDPWGMVLKGAGQVNATTPNKFLFNGKESQPETGMYDFGARMQDPVLGRWFTIDPLAEKGRRWSPYTYAFDNPIRFIDPDGMWPGEGLWSKAKEVMSRATSFVKNSTFKLESNISVGAQVGATINAKGKSLGVDFSPASVKVLGHSTELKNGKITETVQAGTYQKTEEIGSLKAPKIESVPLEVETKFGIGIGAVSAEYGVVNKVSTDGSSNLEDSKRFLKGSAGVGNLSQSVSLEKPYGKPAEVKTVTEFTIDAKVIIGVELKFSIERNEK